MVSANVEYSYMLALDTDNLERHKKGGQDEFQNSVGERSQQQICFSFSYFFTFTFLLALVVFLFPVHKNEEYWI